MTVHAITVTWRGVWLAMLMAATVACGSSPTAPDDGTTVVLGQQQTTTVTGTDLRITAFTLGMPEAILCLAVPDSPCGQSPAATLRVEIPGAEAQNLGMQVPGPVGANDRFTSRATRYGSRDSSRRGIPTLASRRRGTGWCSS